MTNAWFLDTEFDEDGTTIKLISIALVPLDQSKSTYYRALLDGWNPEDCNAWVQKNVVPLLPAFPLHYDTGPSRLIQSRMRDTGQWATRCAVAHQLEVTLLEDGLPEIWGYFADYDWVVLCQLFGKMIDLPKGMPMFCRDLKQEMERLGVSRDQLPQQEGVAHSALEDARWMREAYLALQRVEHG